ncbi:UNVERIFIED_CONTAM: hypothetical protein RMT77_017282 [Armadillidium vulgare]
MNAITLYLNTCRLVMQADPENRDTYAKLYELLPYLRKSLSCTVCERILSDPFTPTETSCEHHVCKICIGGKKTLKPSCSWCKDYETYIENTQMQIIIQCYRKLCTYLKETCLYKKLSTLFINGGSCNLIALIDEGVSELGLSSTKTSLGRSIDNVNSIEETIPLEESFNNSVSNPYNSSPVISSPILDHYEFGSSSELVNFSTKSDFDFEDQLKVEPKYEENSKDSQSLENITEKDCDSPLLTVDSSAIANDNQLSLSDYSFVNNKSKSNFPMVIFPETSSVNSLTDSNTSLPHCSPTLISSSVSQLLPEPIISNEPPSLEVSLSSSLSSSPSLRLDNKVIFSHSNFSSIEILSSTDPSLSSSNVITPVSSSESKCITQVNNCVNVPISSTLITDYTNTDNHLNLYQDIQPPSELLSVSSPSPYPVVNISESSKVSENLYCQPSSVINSVITPLEIPSNITNTTTSAMTCVFNVSPGTILSSTNLKQTSREPFLKQGTPLNNGSSVYSVMYSNSESTKITIKRKPPDIENLKKIPIDKEKFTIPSQEVKKVKPKPKPKPKRKGCRCGNATPTPGKLTCCGQRCPCYVEAKACIECQCRGCRNPHRPGGKKVRPIIPQLGNIQIHQVQPVHPRVSTISATHNTNTFHPVSVGTMSTQTPIMTTSGTSPQTIRAVHAMHAVQAVHSVGQLHSVPGSVHQLINIGSGIINSNLTAGINVNTDLTLKPVNFALSSIPAQLLIHDDKSTSNSASDNSDIDIDI